MAKFHDHQHIQRAKVEFIKGVREIEIWFGKINELAGPCGAGKTSFVDALQMALAGARAHTDMPITKGAKKGTVEIETTDFIIKKVLAEGKDPYISIKCKTGGKYGQHDLDRLIGKDGLMFDPTEFARWDQKKQTKVIRELAGEAWCDHLDLLTQEEEELKEKRVDIGREIRAIGEPGEEPKKVEPVDFGDLTRQLQEILAFNREQQSLEIEKRRMLLDAEKLSQEIKDAEAMIRSIEEKINAYGEQRETILKQAEEIKIAETKDPDPIQTQLDAANEIAAEARAWAAWKEKVENFEKKQDQYEELTKQIELVRAQRDEHISQANLPISGLSFDGTQILINGLPITELSGGEIIDLSTDVMCALNREFRAMFVQHGEQLDKATFERLIAKAEEHDIQVIMTTVSDDGSGHGDAIHIYEGRVVEKEEEKE